MNHLTELPKASNYRVLIGCERSGTVRRAFNALGFDAWSCDIEPADDRSNRHLQCDLREILDDGWDFMAVMHPPCTRLCNSGVRWLSQYDQLKPPKTREQIWSELDEGASFFSDCLNAQIKHKAVENPQMHKHAKQRIVNFREASQFVQPWHFGDEAFKATGWWLENLPLLEHTNVLNPPKKSEEPERHKAWSKIHYATPGKDRSRIRSQFFPGMSKALAEQWGKYIIDNDTGEF